MNIPVKITNGRENTYKHRGKLRYYGLQYRDKAWQGIVTKRKYKQIQKYCNKNNLKFEINNNFGKRSTTYRSTFFKFNAPFIGNYYFCAYCGKLITGKGITVDHIYPVYKVNKSQRLQNKLKKIGATSVNDWQNLVASCWSCNLKKGTQTGIWILKAKLGKNNWMWIFIWMLRVILIGGMIGMGIAQLSTFFV